jgi:hypothetical protein
MSTTTTAADVEIAILRELRQLKADNRARDRRDRERDRRDRERDAVVLELRRDRDMFARRLAVLEAARMPRDQRDAMLREHVARLTVGRPGFTTAQLFDHAEVDAELASALLHADVTGPRALGQWLHSQIGTRDGVTIARQSRSRQWLVSEST